MFSATKISVINDLRAVLSAKEKAGTKKKKFIVPGDLFLIISKIRKTI